MTTQFHCCPHPLPSLLSTSNRTPEPPLTSAATLWNNVIAPHGAEGSLLLSPSMCHQADETFLTPFEKEITTPWDVTNLHINKIDMAGVNKDLDYYWNTYGKPMWVTEVSCCVDMTLLWNPGWTCIDMVLSTFITPSHLFGRILLFIPCYP